AIWATGHPNTERLTCQAEVRHRSFEFIDQAGQSTLRLRDRQAAGRDRRAGHAPLLHQRQVLRPLDTVFVEQAVDRGTVRGVDVAEQQVLLGSDADDWTKPLDDLADPRAKSEAPIVLDASVFDAQAQEPLAVALRLPAVVKVYARDRQLARSTHR